MRPVEEERARRQWLQDDMLLYIGFMKVKERGCTVKEHELLCEKKISGGVIKNGGQGDVVVVGFMSHRFRLEEIGFYFNMRYFEDTVTVGEFG
ncbi:BnaC04g29930D [Brassica napus]|uniref:BnaC04g29930D protein n=1 Tax=Brassica napus TaxID=3708 RepID=A0A078HJ05_BRANA|nr:BnaC04g29930D [Brassica napus]